MAYIDTSHRILEAERAQQNGLISSAIASTLQGLLAMAARGELVYFTRDGLKPMDDYTRENCAIAEQAVSQHFVVTTLSGHDDPLVQDEPIGMTDEDKMYLAQEEAWSTPEQNESLVIVREIGCDQWVNLASPSGFNSDKDKATRFADNRDAQNHISRDRRYKVGLWEFQTVPVSVK